MTRITMRALALMVAAVGMASACGGADTSFRSRPAGAVSESGSDHARFRRVSFTSPISAGPTVLAANCDPAHPTICLQPLNLAPAAVRGDLNGSAVTSGVTISRNGKYPSVSLLAFTGRARGCGTGGALLVVKATLDPGSFTTKGTWAVYSRQGTDELSRLTGGGSMAGDAKAYSFRGRIRCR